MGGWVGGWVGGGDLGGSNELLWRLGGLVSGWVGGWLREEGTMITSSGLQVSATSLMKRYLGWVGGWVGG